MYLKAMTVDKKRSVVYMVKGEVTYGSVDGINELDTHEFDQVDDIFVEGTGKVRFAEFTLEDGTNILVVTSGQMFTLNDNGSTLERVS